MSDRLFFYSKNAISAVRGFLRLSIIMMVFMVLLTFFFMNRGYGLLLFSLLSLYFLVLAFYQGFLIKKLKKSAIIIDDDGLYMKYPGREVLIPKSELVMNQASVSLIKSLLAKKKVFEAIILSDKSVVVNYSFTNSSIDFPKKLVETPFLLDPDVYVDFLNDIKQITSNDNVTLSSEDRPEVIKKTKSNWRILLLAVLGMIFCFVFFFLC